MLLSIWIAFLANTFFLLLEYNLLLLYPFLVTYNSWTLENIIFLFLIYFLFGTLWFQIVKETSILKLTWVNTA